MVSAFMQNQDVGMFVCLSFLASSPHSLTYSQCTNRTMSSSSTGMRGCLTQTGLTFPLHDHAKCPHSPPLPSLSLQSFSICCFIIQHLQGGCCIRLRLAHCERMCISVCTNRPPVCVTERDCVSIPTSCAIQNGWGNPLNSFQGHY